MSLTLPVRVGSAAATPHDQDCFRANRERLERFEDHLTESHGQNLVWTILYVPYSLDFGTLTLTRHGGRGHDTHAFSGE
jgi:hypothetical protein